MKKNKNTSQRKGNNRQNSQKQLMPNGYKHNPEEYGDYKEILTRIKKEFLEEGLFFIRCIKVNCNKQRIIKLQKILIKNSRSYQKVTPQKAGFHFFLHGKTFVLAANSGEELIKKIEIILPKNNIEVFDLRTRTKKTNFDNVLSFKIQNEYLKFNIKGKKNAQRYIAKHFHKTKLKPQQLLTSYVIFGKKIKSLINRDNQKPLEIESESTLLF